MPSSVDDSRLPASTLTDNRGAGLAAAERWLEAELGGQPAPPLLVVIGLGDGELLDVLDRRAPETKVLAFEPDHVAAVRCLRRPDLARRRETGRLAYLVDPDYAGADDAWRMFPTGSDAHRLIVWPAVAREGGPGAVRAARVLKQILFGVQANAEARRRFAPGYLVGSLHNLPEIAAGSDLRSLTNFYRGKPAVILAAGPSLDGALDDVAAVRDRAVLIAADTALRPLIARGLAPHLVVAVDPQATNARHFHELPDCGGTWLVSETSIDPSVVRPFNGRTFWFRVANHEPWSWYHELGVDVGQVDVWGSVLTSAFQVAVLAGCDPIVMAGADLSFTGGRPYCRGTTYEFDWAYLVGEGKGMAQAWRPFLKPDEQIHVPDLHGATTVTTGALQSFRDWMIARAQKSGRRVINATGAGILFGDGVEQSSLQDALPNACEIPAPGAAARKAPCATARPELARRLWDVHRLVCRNEQATPPIDRWKAFSGEGFNLPAIGAAVERAARALERPEATPPLDTGAAVIPWSGLTAGGASSVARHLPEATARLRAALGGAASLPAVDWIDGDHAVGRVALLADAFEILRSIVASSSSADDLDSPVPIDRLGRGPLGALPTWPIEIGWAVRLFEGCLGLAWTSALPAPATEPSFFSRTVTPRDRSSEPAARPVAASTRPHIMHATALLGLEWLLCARHEGAPAGAVRERLAAWWRQLAAAIEAPEDASFDESFALEISCGASSPIPVPLRGGDASLTRVLTGAIRGTQESVDLSRLVMPRVLTDEGMARAVFAYATEAGAVCVGLNRKTSALVREDGSVERHHGWPRPINGELPFGANGAVAWGVGKAVWPDGGPGYVMYRSAPNEEPTIDELPFGPTAGVWHQDRLYWTCFPFGVGTWAPGEAPVFSVPDLTLYAVQPDETGLVLHPRVRGTTGVTERRLPKHGWRWRPGQAPEATELGPFGPASSRSVRGNWTAVAHPEADVVRLESAAGVAVSMICYYPFSVAWAGRSLLVCTNEGEILLFDRLFDVLEERIGR